MQAGGRNQQEFETFRYSNTLTAQLTKDLKATGAMSFIKNNNQLQIELKEEVAQGTYANLAIITHSSSEFIVDFVRVMPGLPLSLIHI